MLDLAKLIHEAIGIESPRGFIAIFAIFGLVACGTLGWLVDKGYRAKLKETSLAQSQSAKGQSDGKNGSTPKLTEFQTGRLMALLSQHAGQKVVIVASVGQDTLNHAKELRTLFMVAGWRVEDPIRQAWQSELSMDLQVSSSNQVPPATTAAQDLVQYFQFVGVKSRSNVILDADIGPDEVVVWVGPQSSEGVNPNAYPPQSTHLHNLKPFQQ